MSDQIACFDLCQNVGMEIEERGRAITTAAVHFPATHGQIRSTLEALQRFADRAISTIDAAHAEWRKQRGVTDAG